MTPSELRLQPDGPIHDPQGVKCDHCPKYFRDDIYIYRHKILCGPCRYKFRTGRWPDRKPPQTGIAQHSVDPSPWQELAVREMEDWNG